MLSAPQAKVQFSKLWWQQKHQGGYLKIQTNQTKTCLHCKTPLVELLGVIWTK